VSLEFLGRLTATSEGERWLVREPPDGATRIACVISDEDPEWLGLVDRAARPWLGFSHPRVSRLRSKAWLDGRLMLVIDDERGPSYGRAAAVLADAPVDRERWAVAQMITLADALAAMASHEPGFIHRRVEDSQLFVDPTGRARLRAPVGLIGKAPPRGYRGAGRITGTFRYLSPEQCKGLPVTPASDVFSLATNLAVALTGVQPFRGDHDFATLQAIVASPPRPIATHAPGLAGVLARAFAKDPDQRYPDPAAFAAELYECVSDAGDYDAVISDRIAAWWPTSPQAAGPLDDFDGPSCRMRWDELVPGEHDEIRHCTSCQQPVVRVRSLAAAVPLAGKHCLSYQPDPRR
jgi:serine/threonine protein kinase